MTPTQTLGYNDQKAGTIDPDLSRADTPKGREYRDGMRAARRDAEAGYGVPEAVKEAIGELKAVAVVEKAISDAGPGGAFVDPTPEKKRVRKGKAVDESQGTFL